MKQEEGAAKREGEICRVQSLLLGGKWRIL
jgi:hypothetical protein